MDQLRRPFLLVAVAMIVLVVLVEVGSRWASGGAAPVARVAQVPGLEELRGAEAASLARVAEPPGRGIFAMALLDGVLAFRIALMGMALVIPARVLGRVQGIATAVLSLLFLLGGIGGLLFLLTELSLMVGLFTAAPFGTLVYLGLWGFFPRGDAAALLSLLLFLKLAFVVFLVLAQPKFLQVKALVALVATSLVANLILAFLHGLIPNPVTSIADEIGAIIVVILGLVWAALMLVGAIPGIVKAVRVDRALAR
ncbi:MAG: hypothetical protein KY462_08930 [Actinobacteria bacterium]|nr:hypothetical protein [Actinomycetota bacterium]